MNTRAIFGRQTGVHGLAAGSLKDLITWGDHLKVDQPQIDAQHEGIFRIALEVADAWHRRAGPARIRELAEKLARVLEAHFRYEEQKLEELAYPRLKQHQEEHRMMLVELASIRDRLNHMSAASGPSAPGFLLHSFLLGVTVGHICHSDMDYCLFARSVDETNQYTWSPS